MTKNNFTSFIVLAGVFVLCVFAFVITYNLLPNNRESNSYYVKVGENMNAKIESLVIKNGELSIVTSGDALEFCAKSTRTIPEPDSLCWQKLVNDSGSIAVYKDKKYYVWIKDSNNNISGTVSVKEKNNGD